MKTRSRRAGPVGRQVKQRSRWYASLLAMVALVACGEPGPTEVTPDPDDPAAKAPVDAYLSAQPAWEEVSPPVAESSDPKQGDPAGPTAAVSSDDPAYNPQFVCTTTPYSLAKNPDKIVTLSTDVGLLVPGMLLQGRSHMAGSLLQLPITQRAPVTLVINETGVGNPSRTVEAPALGSLQTAVNQLIQDAETSSFAYSSAIDFTQVTSHSFEQAALGMGLSVKYLGSSARGSMESRTSAERRTVTASFTQNAFSIRVDRPDLPSGWFTDAFTQAAMDAQVEAGQMGPDNPPLYVSEVTYGRIVIVNFTAEEAASEIEGMFRASVNNGVGRIDGKLTAEQEEMVRNAEIQIVQLGGPAEGGFQFAKEILDPDNPTTVGLDGFFAQDVSLTTFVPISYTLADLRTGQTAKVGELSEYEVLECEPINETIVSDFEATGDVGGWTSNDADLRQVDTNDWAIVGQGYLHVGETTSGISMISAPDKFIGEKAAYVDGTLKFWVGWNVAEAPYGNDLNPLSYPHVRVTGASGRILVYSGALWRIADFGRLQWITRNIALSPGFDEATGVGWRTYSPSAGESLADAVPATAADFEDVFANIVKLELQGEWRGGRRDHGFYDQIEMTPPSR